MSDNTITYPFDPTGTLASNLVSGEIQAISAPDYSDFYFIVPKAAPFFETGLEVVHITSNRVLVEGIDYVLGYKFRDASLACSKNIYGAICFYDKSLAGAVRLKYQTVGGVWTIDETKILELLGNAITNPRVTSWEQVVERPIDFPVIDHQWELADLVGAKELETAILSIVSAIQDSSGSGLPNHLADYNNPHHVTADQVGLGNVQNYGVATPAEAAEGSANNKYMTALRTRQAIMAVLATTLDVHVSNQNNPHGVNAAQVGLSDVQNYGVASVAEAQGGAATNKYMTPALVKAAIDQLVGATLTAHIDNLNNPHQVTKDQVGLGSVQNYPISDVTTARAGVSNSHYMTPAMVREAIAAQSSGGFSSHLTDYNNPHHVTADQVGLGSVQNYPVATVAEAQAGIVSNKYMTPALVKAAIDALGVGNLTAHINNTNNPHLVTKDQVGLGNVQNYGVATTAEATAGVSNVKYMTPALVAAAISATADVSGITAALNAHLAATNPHNITPAMIGAYTAQETEQLVGRFHQTINLVTPISYDNNGTTVTQFAGETWSRLFIYDVPENVNPSRLPAFTFDIVGGDLLTSVEKSSYFINIAPLDPTSMTVNQFAGPPNGLKFGVVSGETSFELWVRVSGPRGSIDITTLSAPSEGITFSGPVLESEPVGIVYTSNVRYLANPANDNGAAGDLLFGQDSYAANSNVGAVVEYLNIVDTSLSEAVSSVNTLTQSLEDAIAGMLPRSFYASSRYATCDDFGYNATAGVVTLIGTDKRLKTLISREAYTNYSFEVEVGSTDVSAQALGVVAAHTVYRGRSIGIYVLRTPGGLVVDAKAGNVSGGDIYGLMTVGVNLMQTGYKLISANSGNGLAWGDNVWADNRDFTTYPFDGTTGNWNHAGPVRLKVTRTGTTLVIETTNHNSTTYVDTAKVTINLGDYPELSGPTNWGICGFMQTASTFKILNRPDALHPYAVLDTDASGSKRTTLYHHNGVSWESSVVNRQTPNARIGRILMSDWNGRLMHWRRDGNIRPLYIEAYTSGDHTVLTP